MAFLALPIAILIVVAAYALPGAWLVMLALGNFGFSQFGLMDCLPLGAVIGMLAPPANKQ